MKTYMVDGIAVDVEGDVDPEKLAAYVRKKVAEAKASQAAKEQKPAKPEES